MSPLARKHEPVGATDFARFWFQALDWGYATTDSTLAKQLYLPVCTDCARFMHNFDDAKVKGEHFRGGRASIAEAYIAPNDRRNNAEVAVDVTIDVDAWRLVDARASIVSDGPAARGRVYRVWMTWPKDEWKIVDFKRGIK